MNLQPDDITEVQKPSTNVSIDANDKKNLNRPRKEETY